MVGKNCGNFMSILTILWVHLWSGLGYDMGLNIKYGAIPIDAKYNTCKKSASLWKSPLRRYIIVNYVAWLQVAVRFIF